MSLASLLVMLALAGVAVPQEADVDEERLIEVAGEIMRAAGECALITVGPEGRPQARAMDAFPPEEDLRVWMGTNPGTRKVAQLRVDPRATLYYYDREGGSYVTLLGEVRIVDDPEERARRFKPEWSEFYDDEHRGPDYVLLEFVPHRVEIVSLEHGVADDPKAWKPAILELPPDDGGG